MYNSIRSYCDSLIGEFAMIPEERKQLLQRISKYIKEKQAMGAPANLVYICTHNSRRSHYGQIWAKVAGEYFNVAGIRTFSGGTEATAFNSNAINALIRVGFKIKPVNFDKNSIYHVQYDEQAAPIECFSKVYDHPKNPHEDFAAIMTCSEAEENCPFIPGVELRVATTYEDPKAFDGKPQQDAVYDERCRQIAREVFYVFSNVSK